ATRYAPKGAYERARSIRATSGEHASVETKAAAAPAANVARVSRGSPRRARRRPFRKVAPAITGSAALRDSTLAAGRSKRSSRAAVSVAPLRDTPGTSAHA